MTYSRPKNGEFFSPPLVRKYNNDDIFSICSNSTFHGFFSSENFNDDACPAILKSIPKVSCSTTVENCPTIPESTEDRDMHYLLYGIIGLCTFLIISTVILNLYLFKNRNPSDYRQIEFAQSTNS